jgi:archaellum component FlaC
MGKAAEKINLLNNQIEDLIKERDSAQIEAIYERREELENDLKKLDKEIETLDKECTNLENNLKDKSNDYNSKRKMKEKLAFEIDELSKQISKSEKALKKE